MSTKNKNQHLINLIERLIKQGNKKQFHLFFLKYHEADIADALEELPNQSKQSFFQIAHPDLAVDVLEEMEMEDQIPLISQFKTELAAKYIERMEPDDAVDLIEELFESDNEKAQLIFNALPPKEAKELKELLAYDDDTAGSLMTSEFLSIPEKLNVQEAIHAIKKQSPPNSEVSYYIFIVDEKKRLIGYTTLRDLLIKDKLTNIKDIRNDYPIKATTSMDQEDVAAMIQKYNLIALPVVDTTNKLVGIITVDDVVDIVVEEATEDIYKLSGTSDISENKLLEGKLIYPIRSRLPWLFITIFGGMAASLIITEFSSHYDGRFSMALILSFIPLLMGLGGNVGNQSATIIVRGLSTGHVKATYYLKTILRETIVGFTLSAIMSAAVFLFNQAFSFPIELTLIVSFSLIANITSAAIIGASLPLIFKKIGIDPAVASAPFISTTLDIISQLIYFFFLLYFTVSL
ncbi:magnesium transporter [bacterium]|jgi:magnesium transporter|nr:magnesium transporter [bacterium]